MSSIESTNSISSLPNDDTLRASVDQQSALASKLIEDVADKRWIRKCQLITWITQAVIIGNKEHIRQSSITFSSH